MKYYFITYQITYEGRINILNQAINESPVLFIKKANAGSTTFIMPVLLNAFEISEFEYYEYSGCTCPSTEEENTPPLKWTKIDKNTPPGEYLLANFYTGDQKYEAYKYDRYKIGSIARPIFDLSIIDKDNKVIPDLFACITKKVKVFPATHYIDLLTIPNP